MGKTPAFQFYPQDFISDINVKLMTCEERGAYISLLCHDWIEKGLPSNDHALSILSGAGTRWPEVKTAVLKCFKKSRSRIYNLRLKRERNKQETFRQSRSVAGKASAKAREAKRLGKDLVGNTCSAHVETSLQHNPTLLSSSSSSTSVKEKETKEKEKVSENSEPPLLYDLPSSVGNMEAGFSNSLKPIEDIYREIKASSGEKIIIDRSTKEAFRTLAQMVDGAEIDMRDLKQRMDAFYKGKTKGEYENWGLKGFANNISTVTSDGQKNVDPHNGQKEFDGSPLY